jgi:TRAP-type C4-dicarboxylate transport system permease small subunit
MFVWSVFLGSALVFGEGEHVSLTFLTDQLSQGVRKWLKIFTHVLMLVTTVWLFVIDGFRIAQRVHYQLSPAMDIPMSIPYLSIFCGGCLMALILFINIVSEILSLSDQKKR